MLIWKNFIRSISLVLLTTMQLFLTSCKHSLAKSKVDKWFYDLPVYERPNIIVAKLLADSRFHLITAPDTLKNTYVYKAFIKKENIPPLIGQPDSATIDFTATKVYSERRLPGKGANFTEIKLLQIDYYFTDTVKIENLYQKSYKDLRTVASSEHDVSESFNGVEDGIGKNIIYVKNNSGSQVLSIIKKTYQSGTKILRLTFMFGDYYKDR